MSCVDQNIYSSELSKIKSSLHLLDGKAGACRALCACAVFGNIPATALLGNNQSFMKVCPVMLRFINETKIVQILHKAFLLQFLRIVLLPLN